MLSARLIATLIAIALMMPIAFAGTGTISMYGTNVSNTQTNLTVTGTDNVVNVTAWNVGSGIKRFTVNVTNASDTLTLNVYNVTTNQVVELKINGVAIDGYLSNSNGLVTFTRTQPTGNVTWDIRPAIVSGGYNWTWGYFQNLIVTTLTTIYNVTVYNASAINGDGSGITNLNLSNASAGTIPSARYGTGIYVANVTGIFSNVSVYGQTAITDYAVFVNGSGLNMTQSGRNITIASTVQSVTNQTTYTLNTVYTNSNTRSLMIFVTMNFSSSVAGGSSLAWVTSPSGTNASGLVGIESGVLNEEIAIQLVGVVAPNTSYAVNTSVTNGAVILKNWREIYI